VITKWILVFGAFGLETFFSSQSSGKAAKVCLPSIGNGLNPLGRPPKSLPSIALVFKQISR
jgi:hypothetical protein